jgi:ubiquinone/menaquinone biosynthesis C-methylase UbiE
LGKNIKLYPSYRSLANRRFYHFRYALKALENVRGKVLDIGCGKGEIALEIKKIRPDLEIVGCDQKPTNPKIVPADAQKLPFLNQSFAAVLMFDVLEHLRQPQRAVIETNRILKKGGIFYLAVPCEKSLASWDGWLYRFFRLNLKKIPVGHVNLFTAHEIKNMVKQAGFSLADWHFSQHLTDQFFTFFYYFFVWLFRRGRYYNLRQKGEKFWWLLFFLSFFSVLANLESGFMQKVPGRTLHLTCRKI